MKRRRLSSTSTTSRASSIIAHSEVNTSDPPLELATLNRLVSPPPRKKAVNVKSATAKVESGEAIVEEHVAFFASRLLAASLPDTPGQPRLSHAALLALYNRNLNDQGHHFVIHQHDHPVAGMHYDLRLQCNATSSLSFAIMYGLPGDPNSRRLNRIATETRVHNLWNHVIETASAQTGTMLIWDTGEYEVLPISVKEPLATTSNSESDQSDLDSNVNRGSDRSTSANNPQSAFDSLSQPERLAHAFSRRKIRLCLHGTRLPPGYTVYMRLTTTNFRSTQPAPPSFRRGRRRGRRRTTTRSTQHRASSTPDSDSDSDSDSNSESKSRMMGNSKPLSSLDATARPPASPIPPGSCSQDEDDNNNNDAAAIRANNAYPGGAINSNGSIYQRKWYLSLDRRASGFVPTNQVPKGHHSRTYWVRRPLPSGTEEPQRQGEQAGEEEQKEKGNKDRRGGFKAFHVLGREHERSVITGRLARDILRDEGVQNFVPRAHWKAVVE